MTPASYRAGGAGADIRYTTTATPLGRLLHRDRGARPTTSPADDSDSDDTRGGES